MAKTPSGLPADFDISVSAKDLTGPATLPGYLDDDPVVAFARMQREQGKGTPPKPAANVVKEGTPSGVSPRVETSKVFSPRVEPQKQLQQQQATTVPEIRRRLQINLDADTDRMVEEILDLLSNQSAEHRIKVSELFQALLLSLYNAKGEIVLGSLPVRGRWGSPTAKAFPVALSESLREAIVNHEKAIGGNPFKKAVGG